MPDRPGETRRRWSSSSRRTAPSSTGGLPMALALCAGAATMPARADYPVAPDVVVFCEPTLQHAVVDIGMLWRKQTGVSLRVFTSPSWALLEQIAHHTRSDLVVGEGEAAAA